MVFNYYLCRNYYGIYDYYKVRQKGQKGGYMADRRKVTPEEREYQKQKKKDSIRIATWSLSLPPINSDDPEQVKDRMLLYFDFCEQNSYVIGLEGLCNALKISTTTFKAWLNGSARKGQEHQRLCQEAEQVIKAYMEGELLAGEVNPVSAIFLMSNLHGYVQKTTVATETAPSVIDTATPEQLAKRYAEGSIIDVVYEEVKPKKEIAAESSSQKVEQKVIETQKEVV